MKTKYELNQNVWYMNEGNPIEVPIIAIREIREKQVVIGRIISGYFLKSEMPETLKTEYDIAISGVPYTSEFKRKTVTESEIFKTIEELRENEIEKLNQKFKTNENH